MDHPTVLLTRLHDLDRLLADDGPTLEASLNALIDALGAAIASYQGMELTMTQNAHPVVLTTFSAPPSQADATDPAAGRAPLTSLRLPLALIDAAFDAGSRIVVYAGTPGTLVDLAADLTYALTPRADGSPPHRAGRSEDTGAAGGVNASPLMIVLDVDLPPATRSSGVAGLAELSTISRATGVMIDRGHHPDDVDDTLRRHAAAADLCPHAYAVRLLAAANPSRPHAEPKTRCKVQLCGRTWPGRLACPRWSSGRGAPRPRRAPDRG